MKIGTWVTLNQRSFRNNTENWKATWRLLEGKDREKARKGRWIFLPVHESTTVKWPCSPTDFSFPTHAQLRERGPSSRLSPRVTRMTEFTAISHTGGHLLGSLELFPREDGSRFLSSFRELTAGRAWSPLLRTWVNELQPTLDHILRISGRNFQNDRLNAPSTLIVSTLHGHCAQLLTWTDS